MGKLNLNSLNTHYEYLHTYPEPGFLEKKTKKYIKKHLDNILSIEKIFDGKSGIIYRYTGKNSSDYDLAFRAELDAVEIDEYSKVYYHGCGHDAHISIQLELIMYVAKVKPKLNIIFIFQASEEKWGGAKEICNFLKKRSIFISKIYALHVTSDLYPGYVSIGRGDILAAGLTSRIKIFVKNDGHVSNNHENVASIFSKVVRVAEKLNSKNFKCVITNFSSNGSHNVPATELFFNITFRGKSSNICQYKKHFFLNQLNIEYQDEIIMDYPVLHNDNKLCSWVYQNISKNKIIKILRTPFIFSCDDFSFYSQELNTATCYFFIGAYNNGIPIHSNKFIVPKSTLAYGLYLLILLLKNEDM